MHYNLPEYFDQSAFLNLIPFPIAPDLAQLRKTTHSNVAAKTYWAPLTQSYLNTEQLVADIEQQAWLPLTNLDFFVHLYWLRVAYQQAQRALLTTLPNPRVGCVIVRQGAVIASGYHQHAGCGHAEARALASIDKLQAEDVVYCTLEPCANKVNALTPSCAEALVAKGCKTIVLGAYDPTTAVHGSGVAYLQSHGVNVYLIADLFRDFVGDFIELVEQLAAKAKAEPTSQSRQLLADLGAIQASGEQSLNLSADFEQLQKIVAAWKQQASAQARAQALTEFRQWLNRTDKKYARSLAECFDGVLDLIDNSLNNDFTYLKLRQGQLASPVFSYQSLEQVQQWQREGLGYLLGTLAPTESQEFGILERQASNEQTKSALTSEQTTQPLQGANTVPDQAKLSYQLGLPYIALKVATSLDGFMCLSSGESKWITDAKARGLAQHLRLTHQVLVTTAQTVIADQASYKARLSELTSYNLAGLAIQGRYYQGKQQLHAAVALLDWQNQLAVDSPIVGAHNNALAAQLNQLDQALAQAFFAYKAQLKQESGKANGEAFAGFSACESFATWAQSYQVEVGSPEAKQTLPLAQLADYCKELLAQVPPVYQGDGKRLLALKTQTSTVLLRAATPPRANPQALTAEPNSESYWQTRLNLVSPDHQALADCFSSAASVASSVAASVASSLASPVDSPVTTTEAQDSGQHALALAELIAYHPVALVFTQAKQSRLLSQLQPCLELLQRLAEGKLAEVFSEVFAESFTEKFAELATASDEPALQVGFAQLALGAKLECLGRERALIIFPEFPKDLRSVMLALGCLYDSALVEAGPTLTSAFVEELLFHRIYHFQATKLLGAGKSAWAYQGLAPATQYYTSLATAPELRLAYQSQISNQASLSVLENPLVDFLREHADWQL